MPASLIELKNPWEKVVDKRFKNTVDSAVKQQKLMSLRINSSHTNSDVSELVIDC